MKKFSVVALFLLVTAMLYANGSDDKVAGGTAVSEEKPVKLTLATVDAVGTLAESNG